MKDTLNRSGLPLLADIPVWVHLLLVGAGIFAGFVNTVAGAGSALTLPALIASGVDATVANASNRVAVVVQTLSGAAAFHRRGVRPWRTCLPVVAPLALGGLGGAWMATQVSPGGLQVLFGLLFILLAAALAFRPRWLTPPTYTASERRPPSRSLATQGAFFALGLYGGFVQAGVGIPLLLLLVQRLGLEVVAGNAAKTALTLVFTAIALVVFQGSGQVDWLRGGEVACGSLVGSLIGVEATLRVGVETIRKAVIFGLLLAAARMLW